MKLCSSQSGLELCPHTIHWSPSLAASAAISPTVLLPWAPSLLYISVSASAQSLCIPLVSLPAHLPSTQTATPNSMVHSLSFSSTPKALLYFLVTLIDCINLSAYWISSASCREPCTICL